MSGKPYLPLDAPKEHFVSKCVKAVEDNILFLSATALSYSFIKTGQPAVDLAIGAFVGDYVQDFIRFETPELVFLDDDYSRSQITRLKEIVRNDPEAACAIDALERKGWCFKACKYVYRAPTRWQSESSCVSYADKICGVDKETLQNDHLALYAFLHEIRHADCPELQEECRRERFVNDSIMQSTFEGYCYYHLNKQLSKKTRRQHAYTHRASERDANQFADRIMHRTFPVEYALYRLTEIDFRLSLFSIYLNRVSKVVENTGRSLVGKPLDKIYIKPVSSSDYLVSSHRFGEPTEVLLTRDEVLSFKEAYGRYLKTGEYQMKLKERA